jgi:hypothetical protein
MKTLRKKNPTWRVTIANDFEGFERCEIRELGGERHVNSRKGQLSTSKRAIISDDERRVKGGKRSWRLITTRRGRCHRIAHRSKYRI